MNPSNRMNAGHDVGDAADEPGIVGFSPEASSADVLQWLEEEVGLLYEWLDSLAGSDSPAQIQPHRIARMTRDRLELVVRGLGVALERLEVPGSEGGEATEPDLLCEQVMTCVPALAPERMEEVAALVLDLGRVIRPWRLAALLASKDGAFFRELSEDVGKAKALAPDVDLLADFACLLRSMADHAECASSRVMIAGFNHEHFEDWMTGG